MSYYTERFPHLAKMQRLDADTMAALQKELSLVCGQLRKQGWLKDDGTLYEPPTDFAEVLEEWLVKRANDKMARDAQINAEWKETEAKLQADREALLSKERDRLAAIARLDEYERVRGLISSDHNVQAITDFIQNSDELKGSKGYWSVATVDAAIAFLGPRGKNMLEFVTPKSAAAAPASTTLSPTYLPNGELQLPLGTTPNRSHSVAALKDLDKRTRESLGLNKTRHGWHGGGRI